MVEEGQTTYNNIKQNLKALQIVEVAGYDGTKQELSTLTIDVKPYLRDNFLPLDYLTLLLKYNDQQSILAYKGPNATYTNSIDGYYTFSPQEFGELTYTVSPLSLILSIQDDVPYILPIDLDNDGSATDTIEVCDNDAIGASCPSGYDGSYLLVDLSSTSQNYFVALRNQDNSLANISTGGETVNVVNQPITGGWGTMSISGTTSFPYEIDSSFTVTISKTGYPFNADLDGDGKTDYLGLNATDAFFFLSTESSPLVYPLGVDLSSGPVTLDNEIRAVGTNGTIFGTLALSGTTSNADVIDASAGVTFTPYRLGRGYYSVEPLFESPDYRNGYFTDGDVLRFHLATLNNITSDSTIDIILLYKGLEITNKQIYVGNTFPYAEKVALFPKP